MFIEKSRKKLNDIVCNTGNRIAPHFGNFLTGPVSYRSVMGVCAGLMPTILAYNYLQNTNQPESLKLLEALSINAFRCIPGLTGAIGYEFGYLFDEILTPKYSNGKVNKWHRGEC